MHWIQDEKPIEHHLSGWHDYAHHHETGKKKMLGGVSFEGGGAAGGSKGNTASQAGVQTAQPSFSDIQALGFGTGKILGNARQGNSMQGSDKKADDISKSRKDTVSIQESHKDMAARETAGQQIAAQTIVSAQTIVPTQPSVSGADADMDRIATVMESIPLKAQRRFDFDYKKYIGKLRNGIQTFLKGMEQKAGKENRQKPKKKEKSGTHAVTKEEVYEIQANTAYLLDSYNKNGERSTLGK